MSIHIDRDGIETDTRCKAHVTTTPTPQSATAPRGVYFPAATIRPFSQVTGAAAIAADVAQA